MKLGLISDIHADLNGLNMALELLESQGVDKIICAGDLVERGTDGDAVVQCIREQNIICVRGNHDQDAVLNQIPLKKWLRENPDYEDLRLRSQILSEDTMSHLRTLPLSLRYKWEDLRVLITHGTPESNMDYLFPNSPKIKFKTVAREAQADVIIFGHTHEPTYAKFMGVKFFNPGSIYAEKMRGSRTCATLTLPDCIYQVFNIDSGERIAIPIVR